MSKTRYQGSIKVMPERLPNTYPEKDRHGKIRWRFRKKGFPSAQLRGEPGSKEFLKSYLLATGEKIEIQAPIPVIEGSLRSLINDFTSDKSFKKGRNSDTQKNYRAIYDRLCLSRGTTSKRLRGEMPYSKATPKALRSIVRDRFNQTERGGQRLHTALVMLFDYAVDTDRLERNPMNDVKRPRAEKTKGFHSWTNEEIALYRASHSIGTNERLAFELLLYTGLRGANVYDLGWQHVKNGYLRINPAKSQDATLMIPITGDFSEVLETARGNMSFIVNSKGRPYSKKAFQQWFSKSCTSIGLPHCSAHGLRKARGRIMAESACTENEIMAVLGHKTSAMAVKYTRGARQKILSDSAYGKTEVSEPLKVRKNGV